MTKEQQRIAFAEAIGWGKEYADIPTWNPSLNNYQGKYETVTTEVFRKGGKAVVAKNLPNIDDLNVIHEAVVKWADDSIKKFNYHRALSEVVGRASNSFPGYNVWDAENASAPQRREAFLKTVGKWKES